METEWPSMTVDSLKDCNKKVLARMAKEQGVVGWHAMRKDQLIRPLTPTSAKKVAAKAVVKPAANPRRPSPSPNGAQPKPLTVAPPRPPEHARVKHRILVLVRDPYWLHPYWQLTRTPPPAPR